MPAVANSKKTCRFYVNFYKLDSFTQLLHSFVHSLIDRLLVDTERNQKPKRTENCHLLSVIVFTKEYPPSAAHHSPPLSFNPLALSLGVCSLTDSYRLDLPF